jgi:hypothetical protein
MRFGFGLGMIGDDDAAGEAELGQQQLRQHIENSKRMIGEAQQRVDSSRALTSDGMAGQVESD